MNKTSILSRKIATQYKHGILQHLPGVSTAMMLRPGLGAAFPDLYNKGNSNE